MSVEDKNIIDAISKTSDGEKVVLTISDHLDWDEKNEHLLVLQDKINTYLDAIESGQLYEVYPESVGKKIMIEISFKYFPNKTGKEFLSRVKEFLTTNDYEFNYYFLG